VVVIPKVRESYISAWDRYVTFFADMVEWVALFENNLSSEDVKKMSIGAMMEACIRPGDLYAVFVEKKDGGNCRAKKQAPRKPGEQESAEGRAGSGGDLGAAARAWVKKCSGISVREIKGQEEHS
jgi:hypothetical protein